jgi:phage terminase Nu1 subunit (DNA packaging protein)
MIEVVTYKKTFFIDEYRKITTRYVSQYHDLSMRAIQKWCKLNDMPHKGVGKGIEYIWTTEWYIKWLHRNDYRKSVKKSPVMTKQTPLKIPSKIFATKGGKIIEITNPLTTRIIAKHYDITMRAIQKWCKAHGMPYKGIGRGKEYIWDYAWYEKWLGR